MGIANSVSADPVIETSWPAATTANRRMLGLGPAEDIPEPGYAGAGPPPPPPGDAERSPFAPASRKARGSPFARVPRKARGSAFAVVSRGSPPAVVSREPRGSPFAGVAVSAAPGAAVETSWSHQVESSRRRYGSVRPAAMAGGIPVTIAASSSARYFMKK